MCDQDVHMAHRRGSEEEINMQPTVEKDQRNLDVTTGAGKTDSGSQR